MNKPKLTTVANHFLNAKEVKCLKTGLVIDVTSNSSYEFNKLNKSYTSVGGAVTFWKDGEYAEIISCISKKCKNCKCNEKK